MHDPSDLPPPVPKRHNPPAPRTVHRPLGFVAGLAAGFGLWLVIQLATGNLILGLAFGLAPGLAIGIGLEFTARR